MWYKTLTKKTINNILPQDPQSIHSIGMFHTHLFSEFFFVPWWYVFLCTTSLYGWRQIFYYNIMCMYVQYLKRNTYIHTLNNNNKEEKKIYVSLSHSHLLKLMTGDIIVRIYVFTIYVRFFIFLLGIPSLFCCCCTLYECSTHMWRHMCVFFVVWKSRRRKCC